MYKDYIGVVYCYTCPDGKKYIGQTFCEKRRIADHRRANQNTLFHEAIRKIGFDHFKYELLHNNIQSREELEKLEEIEVIKNNSVYPNGYNARYGGGSCAKNSDRTKEKISIANTGNKLPGVSIANKNRVWNPETLKLRIIRMSGSGNFRARKVRCVETGEIFLTTVDAARSCGSLSKSQISKCAKGKIKSAFGYKWEYA